jgi:hypothetical protein
VATVIPIFEIVAFMDIAGVVKVIALHVLAVKAMVVLHDFFPRQHLHALAGKLHRTMTASIQLGNLFEIILPRMWLIENVIFLVPKSHTPKTVPAPDAVNKKLRVRAVIAIPGERETVALDAIDAFVASLAAIDVEAVVAIFRLPDDVAVRTVLVLDISEDEIAIA